MPADVKPRSKPLQDIRVLELGDNVAAAFCGMLLANFGADVTVLHRKEEMRFTSHMAGGGLDIYLDSAKDMRALAPDTPKGLAAVLDQLAQFDVLLTDEAIGKASFLASHEPHVLVVHFSAFGETGPYQHLEASELVVQAAGGLLALLGDPKREPIMLAGQQAAYATGSLAFSALMAALTYRDLSKDNSSGQIIEISELESIANLEWKGPVYYQAAGEIVPRGKETGPLILPCNDGFIGFYYTAAHWSLVLELFGKPADLSQQKFETQAGRMATQDELEELLASRTRIMSKHDLYHAAQKLGIPVGPVETVADLVAYEPYRSSGFLQPPPGATGILRPVSPFTFNGARFCASHRSENLTPATKVGHS
jgi:crotonobetainyl-CoA:carnitine CoA-transferase CaiB-like acyl-CoA transferase